MICSELLISPFQMLHRKVAVRGHQISEFDLCSKLTVGSNLNKAIPAMSGGVAHFHESAIIMLCPELIKITCNYPDF